MTTIMMYWSYMVQQPNNYTVECFVDLCAHMFKTKSESIYKTTINRWQSL